MFSIIRQISRAASGGNRRCYSNMYPKKQAIVLCIPRINGNINKPSELVIKNREKVFVIPGNTPIGFQIYNINNNVLNEITLKKVDYEILLHKVYNKRDYFKRKMEIETNDSYINGLAITSAIAHWNLQASGIDIVTDLFTEYSIGYNEKKLLTYFGIHNIYQLYIFF